MKKWSYPISIAVGLTFIGVFAVRDYQMNRDLLGLLVWTIGPIALILASILSYNHVISRSIQRSLDNNAPNDHQTSVICINRERTEDLPEEYGSWPVGRLYLLVASRRGIELVDKSGVKTRIPRQHVTSIEVEYVDYYAIHVPAFRFNVAESTQPIYAIPSSRILPGQTSTHRTTVRLTKLLFSQISI